ncbi:MAG TPA: hypothetical protein VFJ43_15155 [Bacteroidia bacterium]|nr:hypothetical protein [Bacteroidia bacterium]
MSSIFVKNPCPENWDEMKPEEKGRFCDKCCKVVMDFTKSSTEEILEVLQNAKGKICGRVMPEKLTPVPVFSSPLRRTKLFAIALFFVFGGMLFGSCKSHKQTKPLQGDVEANYFSSGHKAHVHNGFQPVPLKKH